MDGVLYYRMAEELGHGETLQAPAPFVYRIGTPLMASLAFKDDLLLSFKVVNIAAGACATILLVLWLRLHLDSWEVRALLVLLFLTQWHAPVRHVYFYPALTDPWHYVAILAGLIAMEKVKVAPSAAAIGAATVIALLGVINREVAIVVALALPFVHNPIALHVRTSLGRLHPSLFIPLVAGVLGIAVTHWTTVPTNDYSFTRTAVGWAHDKPLLAYVHAWLIAFGPVLVLPVYHWRASGAFLRNHQDQLVCLVALSVAGWIGGFNTERFLYWSMPIVYVLVGRALERHAGLLLSSPFLLAVLATGQAVSQRVFWTTPDYPTQYARWLPILTPPSSAAPYQDLAALGGSRLVATISLAQYLLLGAVLLVWLKRRNRNLERDATGRPEFVPRHPR